MITKINGKELEKNFIFSGGEVQIRLPEIEKGIDIEVNVRITSSDKFFELLLIKNALDFYHKDSVKTLNLSYMPYARQDRHCYDGEAFSLSVAVDMINYMSFDRVVIDDVHSDICVNFLKVNNATYRSTLCLIKSMPTILKGIDVLVSPDKGASEKVKEVGQYFNIPVVYCDKIRNPENGYISSITINDTGAINGKSALIIDDICDGGMTFELLSKELKKNNTSKISLYVTHGIFSKGIDKLKEAGIEGIFTVNNFLTEEYK